MESPKKDEHAVALGRKGGLARTKKMTKEQLSEHGRMAVQARWKKHHTQEKKSLVDES